MNPIERFALTRGPAGMMLALLAASLGVVLVTAGQFQADVSELAAMEGAPMFSEHKVGFDKHKDTFYYSDNKVASQYARANYLATQLTLAGQAADLVDRQVEPAVNPFGVGQRTFKNFGVIKDRWDVKDTGNVHKTQYLGLFHGKGRDLVVNKVRANLLRHLANAVGDQVPVLDRTAEEDAEEYPEDVAKIQAEVRATIERVYMEVDTSIRNLMVDSDDSRSTATVVIVTPKHVITVNVGGGAVVAYKDADDDENDETVLAEPDDEPNNVFGAKKSRKEAPIRPNVQFFKRRQRDFKFLLIETPSVASVLDVHTATTTVKESMKNHRGDPAREQEIYSGAVMNLLSKIDDSLGQVHKFWMHSDYSVMLVGLDTDYENIF